MLVDTVALFGVTIVFELCGPTHYLSVLLLWLRVLCCYCQSVWYYLMPEWVSANVIAKMFSALIVIDFLSAIEIVGAIIVVEKYNATVVA